MRCRWEWGLPATKSINSSLQKITLPCRPLLSYHSDADTHHRDVTVASYNWRSTHLWCSGDFFGTTIAVLSQVYVLYGASDMILKNTTPHSCIVSSQYDCIVAAIFGFGRYICYQPRVYFIGHYEPSYSSQAYILYVNKILSFITHLHEQYVVHQLPYSLLNYSQCQR